MYSIASYHFWVACLPRLACSLLGQYAFESHCTLKCRPDHPECRTLELCYGLLWSDRPPPGAQPVEKIDLNCSRLLLSSLELGLEGDSLRQISVNALSHVRKKSFDLLLDGRPHLTH